MARGGHGAAALGAALVEAFRPRRGGPGRSQDAPIAPRTLRASIRPGQRFTTNA